jgi:hypothetical protein
VNTTTADEFERLRAAELEAERRYYEAMEYSRVSAARKAADDWLRATNALAYYVAKHPNLDLEMA